MMNTDVIDDTHSIQNGLFKATERWNEIVKDFRSGLPLKRHRRTMKLYNDTFVASDAVDWLESYLNLNRNLNFSNRITRLQTVQLLEKFLKGGIIENIYDGKKMIFKDNKELYRFTHVTSARAPLKVCTDENVQKNACMDNRGIEIHKSSAIQRRDAKKHKLIFRPHEAAKCDSIVNAAGIESIWMSSFYDSFHHTICHLVTAGDVLSKIKINSKYVIHNACRVGVSGIVTNFNPSNELPHWVISAMECLATWPKAVTDFESFLPSYPGFERDVFRVVRQYFQSFREPLTTFKLFDVLISVFVCVEKMDPDLSKMSKTDNSPDKMTMNEGSNLQKTLIYSGSGYRSSCPNLSPTNPISCKCTAGNKELPVPLHYETEFSTSNPVTRILVSPSDKMLTGVLSAKPDAVHKYRESNDMKMLSLSSRSTSADNLKCECKQNITSLSAENSMCQIISHAVHFKNQNQSQMLQPSVLLNISGGYVNLGCTETSGYSNEDKADDDVLNVSSGNLKRSVSAYDLSFREDINVATDLEKATSDCWIWNSCDPCLHQSANTCILTTQGKRLIVKAFQLCFLLIPPDNRRSLHRLLRFLSRIEGNRQLKLDACMTNRDLILKEFARILVCPKESDKQDKLVTMRVVSFLLDNHNEVLAVPISLVKEVEKRLSSETIKTEFLVDDNNEIGCSSLTYCKQVTTQQYEKQKRKISENAVADLLSNIVMDPNLSEKEKKKRLKQFKRTYPDIYSQKFPPDACNKKSQSNLLKKPLKKLLDIRL